MSNRERVRSRENLEREVKRMPLYFWWDIKGVVVASQCSYVIMLFDCEDTKKSWLDLDAVSEWKTKYNLSLVYSDLIQKLRVETKWQEGYENG